MPEVKYRGPGPEKRIADRLRPSNEHSSADHHASHGAGPNSDSDHDPWIRVAGSAWPHADGSPGSEGW